MSCVRSKLIQRSLLALGLLSFFFVSDSHAVFKVCLNQALLDSLGGGPKGFGRNVDSTYYIGDNAILVLGDGDPFAEAKSKGSFSIAGVLHQKFPHKTIVSSDVSFPDKASQSLGLTRVRVDHKKAFPFADNSFDKIVMRQGLCLCFAPQTCAGFCATSAKEVGHFFSEVARVLDKNDKNARAYLHGETGVFRGGPTDVLWQSMLQAVEDAHGVHAQMHYSPEGLLNSVTLSPR